MLNRNMSIASQYGPRLIATLHDQWTHLNPIVEMMNLSRQQRRPDLGVLTLN